MSSTLTVAVGLFGFLTAGIADAPSFTAGAAGSQRGPATTGPGSLAAARQYLEGRWSLISFDVHPPGRPVIHVEGAGTLTYDAFGNLQMEVRVPPAAVEPLRVAGIATEQGVLSVGGRAAIDMQSRTLTYFTPGQPPLGAPSGPLALNRPRHWEVEGSVLTLTTKGDAGQPLSIARWEKAP
jgi:hypothetical protein